MKKKVIETYINKTTCIVKIIIQNEVICTTMNHPFYVKGQGFIAAGKLSKGDEIMNASGGSYPVECVELEERQEVVYNFQVEDYHTYFVGENSILVHNDCPEGKAPTEDGLDTVIKNGKITIDDIKSNPDAFSGKSANEIAQMLKDAGYDVTVKASQRSSSGAKIIKINNPGGGKNITQVQVSPGGGRHGANPYVKISTSDQGIIKIVDGIEDVYKTDGKETSTIIFTGGK
ncbi:polymorphic toxin-type HINT domain-containing protein [Anaerosporobacter mobilis]|nr:polymorphic toxin-type HINT domain-containing protein [Anaerosporobacter mobilis]